MLNKYLLSFCYVLTVQLMPPIHLKAGKQLIPILSPSRAAEYVKPLAKLLAQNASEKHMDLCLVYTHLTAS